MSSIAIIPARGGSKRIPRKNIRQFLGKPIIAYSIQAALDCNLFDDVMVSTDDDEIASIAKAYGAAVPFRRSERNANDIASTLDVVLEVLQVYEGLGKYFDTGCCIYPTAPFAKPSHLLKGYHMLNDMKFDTVFPITPFSYPIWRALEVVDEKVRMIWPEHVATRSQDLTKSFHDAGQWYWFKIDKIKLAKKLWTENSYGVIINETEVQDIDNESDWLIAEMKYRIINGSFPTPNN
jgi:pseudaminic acid cytidylyltransferase